MEAVSATRIGSPVLASISRVGQAGTSEYLERHVGLSGTGIARLPDDGREGPADPKAWVVVVR
jgi:hypothetical protein